MYQELDNNHLLFLMMSKSNLPKFELDQQRPPLVVVVFADLFVCLFQSRAGIGLHQQINSLDPRLK